MNYLIKKISIAAVVAAIINACSSGSPSNNDKPTNIKPQGPISYVSYSSLFVQPSSTKLPNKSLQAYGSCGTVMGDVGTSVSVASGFVSLIPAIGPALGAIGTTVSSILGGASGADASNCQAIEFATLSSQLYDVQTSIANLQTVLNLTTNSIWNAMLTTSNEDLNNSYTTFNNDVNSILGTTGGFLTNVMTKSGAWNANTQLPNSNIDSTMSLLSESNSSNYTSLYNYIDSASITDNLEQIAGVTVTNYQTSQTVEISPDSSSALMILLSELNSHLQTEITTELQSSSESNTNIIPLLENYNETLVAIYQQAIYSLNAAYQIAYMNNQLNYYNYIGGGTYSDGTPIYYLGDITNIIGTYYNPSDISSPFTNDATGQANYYNSAQENLTSIYAQGLNQLYLNIISYIITDAPVGEQFYPDNSSMYAVDSSGNIVPTGESINYTESIGINAVVSGSHLTGAKAILYAALQNGFDATGENLITSLESASSGNSGLYTPESMVYYQYSGLNNLALIESQLLQYNAINQASGSESGFINYLTTQAVQPAILTTQTGESVNASIVSFNTIQPYYVSNGYPKLYGSVTNNIAACNGNNLDGGLPGYNLYNYVPDGSTPTLGQVGTPYLMCGNWSTIWGTNEFEAQVINTDEDFVVTYYIGLSFTANPVDAWEYGTSIVYSNNYGGESTYPMSSFSLPVPSGNPITITNANYTNWGVNTLNTNSNFTLGSNAPQLFAGWMNYNYPSSGYHNGISNIAAIQITLPDGFIAPLSILYTNVNSWEGDFIQIGANTAVYNAAVLIDGSPLISDLNQMNPLNNWGPAITTQQIPTGQYISDGQQVIAYPTGINVNDNMITLNGNATSSSGGFANIILNPDFDSQQIFSNATDQQFQYFQVWSYYTPSPEYNTKYYSM